MAKVGEILKFREEKLQLHELLLSSLWKCVKIKDRKARSENDELQQN